MNKLTINITQDNIKKGRKKDIWACPVTKAIRRDYQRKVIVDEKIIFQDTREEYMISTDLYKWLLDYDDGLEVKPTAFTLKKLDLKVKGIL